MAGFENEFSLICANFSCRTTYSYYNI